jgi:hypothetical protein
VPTCIGYGASYNFKRKSALNDALDASSCHIMPLGLSSGWRGCQAPASLHILTMPLLAAAPPITNVHYERAYSTSWRFHIHFSYIARRRVEDRIGGEISAEAETNYYVESKQCACGELRTSGMEEVYPHNISNYLPLIYSFCTTHPLQRLFPLMPCMILL